MKQQKTSPETEAVLATTATADISSTTAPGVDTEPEAISEPVANEPTANAAIINDIKAMLADMRKTNALIATAAAARVETIAEANEPTANATTHDDLQTLIAELKEANALIAVDIRRAAEAAEATTDGVDTIERNEPTISNAKGKGKGKAPKPINDKQRTLIDGWLEKLFDAPTNVHAMVLAHMPKTLKVYRLLHDAAKRGNWRASAIHLELTHPDRWAPKVENIIYADADHSEKMFRKQRKAGRHNGKAK